MRACAPAPLAPAQMRWICEDFQLFTGDAMRRCSSDASGLLRGHEK